MHAQPRSAVRAQHIHTGNLTVFKHIGIDAVECVPFEHKSALGIQRHRETGSLFDAALAGEFRA